MADNLSAEQEKMMRENSLAFFGAITASVTHEMNNYIAIIDQTSGLLSDLLSFSEGEIILKKERLQSIVDKIDRNTRRGVALLKRLNTFAHCVDSPESEFELNDMIDNFVQLTQRLAKMKKLELLFEKTDEQIKLISNPFIIQEILIYYLRIFFTSSPAEGIINFTVSSDNNLITVSIKSGKTDNPPVFSENEYIDMLVEKISAKITASAAVEGSSVILSIPIDKLMIQQPNQR